MFYLRIFTVLCAAIIGCAAITPTIKSALEVIGPAAVDALSQLVLDEYGDDAQLVMESAGCFPVSELSVEALASLVGDDQQDYIYIACRVKVR